MYCVNYFLWLINLSVIANLPYVLVANVALTIVVHTMVIS